MDKIFAFRLGYWDQSALCNTNCETWKKILTQIHQRLKTKSLNQPQTLSILIVQQNVNLFTLHESINHALQMLTFKQFPIFNMPKKGQMYLLTS